MKCDLRPRCLPPTIRLALLLCLAGLDHAGCAGRLAPSEDDHGQGTLDRGATDLVGDRSGEATVADLSGAPDSLPAKPKCGNGVCDKGETCASCSVDCKGICVPGTTGRCAPCKKGVCGKSCTWEKCDFDCITGCRNGSEVCDDETFTVPSSKPLCLVCKTGRGGVGYLASNTGPHTDPKDPSTRTRCQGWENRGLCPWDKLNYLAKITCAKAGQFVKVDLSSAAGKTRWLGVHDYPPAGKCNLSKRVGMMTEVCVARY